MMSSRFSGISQAPKSAKRIKIQQSQTPQYGLGTGQTTSRLEKWPISAEHTPAACPSHSRLLSLHVPRRDGMLCTDLALFFIIIIIKAVTWLQGSWGCHLEWAEKWQSCTLEQQEISQGFPKFSLLPFPGSWKQICQASIKPSTAEILGIAPH